MRAPHVAQSLFSKRVKYPITMRYSSEPGDPGLDDRVPQPSGLGMRIFNIQDEMFNNGKDYPTLDIEFDSAPAIEQQQGKYLSFGEVHSSKKQLYKHLEARNDNDIQKARDHISDKHLR